MRQVDTYISSYHGMQDKTCILPQEHTKLENQLNTMKQTVEQWQHDAFTARQIGLIDNMLQQQKLPQIDEVRAILAKAERDCQTTTQTDRSAADTVQRVQQQLERNTSRFIRLENLLHHAESTLTQRQQQIINYKTHLALLENRLAVAQDWQCDLEYAATQQESMHIRVALEQAHVFRDDCYRQVVAMRSEFNTVTAALRNAAQTSEEAVKRHEAARIMLADACARRLDAQAWLQTLTTAMNDEALHQTLPVATDEIDSASGNA